MKRNGNLLEKVVESANMFLAFKEAKKGKANKQKVYDFELALGSNIYNLINSIKIKPINQNHIRNSLFMSQKSEQYTLHRLKM